MVIKKSTRSGVIVTRPRLVQRLNFWRKRSPLNPWWIDWRNVRRSIEALAPYSSGTLLDVGGAERPYEPLFAEHVDHYFSLEYPPSVLYKEPNLWSRLERAQGVVDVFGDGNRLPVASDSVDTVLSTEVLEHLPTPQVCVSEMARVLRPGGRLLLTVPFIQPLHELPGDYYRFTEFSLRHMLRAAGLEIEHLEARGNFALALGAMSSQYLVRTLAASKVQMDGSVLVSRWRFALLLPFIALIQLFFHMLSKVTRDQAVTLGYWAVARKPAGR